MSLRASAPVWLQETVHSDAPVRPAPRYMWLIALLAAIALGGAVASPKSAAVVMVLGLFVLGVRSVFARPLNGFLFAFALFPFYPFLRGLATVLGLPLPFAVVGLWPELVLLIMFGAILCQAIMRRRRLVITWHDLPVVFLLLSLVYGLALTVVQRYFAAAVYGFHLSVSSILFYFIARWLPLEKNDLARVLRVSLVAFAVMCVLSLLDYFTHAKLMIDVNVAARPDFNGTYDRYVFYQWYLRLQSLIYAEQIFSTMCAGVCLFCIAALTREKRQQAWATPLLVLSFVCLLLTMSRGGYVCLVASLAAMFLLFRGRHRPLITGAVAFVAVLVVVGLQMYGDDLRVQSVVSRTVALGDPKNQNAYDRVSQWDVALENFPLEPAGIGTGRGGASAVFHGVGGSDKAVGDGGIFKILTEQGVPGVLIFAAYAVGFGYVLLRAVHQSTGLPQTVAIALFCWFCGMLVQNIAGNVFDMFYVMPFFWMMAGFVVLRPETVKARMSKPSALPAAPSYPAIAAAHE